MGKVYLIPCPIGEGDIQNIIPVGNVDCVRNIKYFIVESVRSARRFLKKIDREINIDELTFFELNKHTQHSNVESFLDPADDGNDIGIISDAGCPGVADPGSAVVALAHERNLHVVPLIGPSSILLALMASGMNGQKFTFHGYLPKERTQRVKKIKLLEREAKYGAQIFMETPFRNQHLMDDLLKNCSPKSNLCVAVDISSSKEHIRTMRIEKWKSSKIDLHKRPCIFILG